MSIKKVFALRKTEHEIQRGVRTKVRVEDDGRAYLLLEDNTSVEIKPGDTLVVGTYREPQRNMYNHYGFFYNRDDARREVTSDPPETPLDTPSLDTSFHDREMDV